MDYGRAVSVYQLLRCSEYRSVHYSVYSGSENSHVPHDHQAAEIIKDDDGNAARADGNSEQV